MSSMGNFIANEKGFVLVSVLLTLLLLVVIGIAATSTSTIEVQVSGVDRVYKENFYPAEAATYQAAQSLDDATDSNLSNRNVNGLMLEAALLPTGDADNDLAMSDDEMRRTPDWDPNLVPGPPLSIAAWANGPRYICVDEGLQGGSEALDMSKPQVHAYTIYGKSQQNNGDVTVTIGYRKRFLHE